MDNTKSLYRCYQAAGRKYPFVVERRGWEIYGPITIHRRGSAKHFVGCARSGEMYLPVNGSGYRLLEVPADELIDNSDVAQIRAMRRAEQADALKYVTRVVARGVIPKTKLPPGAITVVMDVHDSTVLNVPATAVRCTCDLHSVLMRYGCQCGGA